MVKSIQALHKEFLDNYSGGLMMSPRLKSVVVSAGCGRFSKNQTVLESVYSDLEKICAQKPVYSKIGKSISNFGVREGNTVGVYVTMRSTNMFNFLNRLILIALPRVQDLQRLSLKSFDKSNNYNFGIKRHDIFPEIDATQHFFGMNVSLQILSRSKTDSIDLLQYLGFPMNVDRGEIKNAN